MPGRATRLADGESRAMRPAAWLASACRWAFSSSFSRRARASPSRMGPLGLVSLPCSSRM
jgi:hypothetical protein